MATEPLINPRWHVCRWCGGLNDLDEPCLCELKQVERRQHHYWPDREHRFNIHAPYARLVLEADAQAHHQLSTEEDGASTGDPQSIKRTVV